jgi:hypothetical protein
LISHITAVKVFLGLDKLLFTRDRYTEEGGGQYKTRTCNFHRVKVALYQLS